MEDVSALRVLRKVILRRLVGLHFCFCQEWIRCMFTVFWGGVGMAGFPEWNFFSKQYQIIRKHSPLSLLMTPQVSNEMEKGVQFNGHLNKVP